MTAALERIQAAGVTLNKEKYEFNKTSLTFLHVDHSIDEKGISPDPHKTTAITKMASPKCMTELRQIMEMEIVNQLGKFSHQLAELSKPNGGTAEQQTSLELGPTQEESFAMVKIELTTQ